MEKSIWNKLELKQTDYDSYDHNSISVELEKIYNWRKLMKNRVQVIVPYNHDYEPRTFGKVVDGCGVFYSGDEVPLGFVMLHVDPKDVKDKNTLTTECKND